MKKTGEPVRTAFEIISDCFLINTKQNIQIQDWKTIPESDGCFILQSKYKIQIQILS